MATKPEHKVQVFMGGLRYIAVELNGKLTLSKDGSPAGTATWKNDQLILSTSMIPDDVVEALEKKLKEAFDNNWGED